MAKPGTKQDAIISEIEIAAPPDQVFRALTDQKQLGVWWTDPGCPIRLFEMEAWRAMALSHPGRRHRS